jgi:uncharacterized glyoxalase superfamily protein PhnB
MKFQFAQSSRQIEATKVTQFNVVQDNRTKQVTILDYYSERFGTKQISFLNGVEAVLNERGRYVQAKSKREDCAIILPDEVPQEELEIEVVAETTTTTTEL